MSSCCGGGAQSVNSTTTLDPDLKSRWLSLANRADTVSQTPYVAYGGPRVAGLSPDQQAAFQTVRDVGAGTGDLNQARSYAMSGAAPLASSVPTFDQAAFDKYKNPYQQQVIDATTGEINRQGELARRDLDTRAATSGGVGAYGPGVRAGLEREEQFRNQADITGRTVAGLNAANYTNAEQQFNTDTNRTLAANQNDAGRAAMAAGQFGTIADMSQQLGLRQANAQVNAGGVEQSQEQRGLDTAYADFLRQQGYPEEQVNFLSGVYRGYPTTSSTTQTSPGANPLSQILGLGIAGLGAAGSAGLFAARGGRIPNDLERVFRRSFADGGPVDNGLSRADMLRLFVGGQRTPAPHSERPNFLSNDSMPAADPTDMSPAYYGNAPELQPDDYWAPVHRENALRYGFDESQAARAAAAAPAPAAAGPRPSRFQVPRTPDARTAGDYGRDPSKPFDIGDYFSSLYAGIRGGPDMPTRPGQDDSGPLYTAPTRYPGEPTGQRGRTPGSLEDAAAVAAPGPGPANGGGGDLASAAVPQRHNGRAPTIDQQGNDISAYTPPMHSRQYADKDAHEAVKAAAGATKGDRNVPDWAMPAMIMGLSMMASRNPSVLGAAGEGGINAMQDWIATRQWRADNDLANYKLDRDLARDEEASRHNQATEANQRYTAEALYGSRGATNDRLAARDAAYIHHLDVLNKNSGRASQGSPITAIVAPILAKVARGETLSAGEQKAYDMYAKASPLDRIIMNAQDQAAATASGEGGADSGGGEGDILGIEQGAGAAAGDDPLNGFIPPPPQ